MAPRSKLTAEVEAAIVEALTAGASRRAAANYAGVSVDSLERWMRRYAAFAATVTRAEARVELRASVTIRQAFEAGDWHAALAWLERRRRDEWGKVERVEIVEDVKRLVRDAGLGDDVEEDAIAYAETYLRSLRRGNARG